MSKPDITAQKAGAFLNGPELYVNDCAIHAEINGNLMPRTNVKLVHSYHHVTGWSLPFQTMNEPFIEYWESGSKFIVFTWLAPRDCTIVSAQAIGYGGANFTGVATPPTFNPALDFTDGSAVGGIGNNFVTVTVESHNPVDETITTVTSFDIENANTDNLVLLTHFVAAGNVVQVLMERSDSGNAQFSPYVQIQLLIKEEHM